MKVGVIGCGVISRAYAENARAFDAFELVACADLDPTQAIALAKASGLRTATVDDLIADPAIDVILNLTPAPAHAAVIARALAAGKHVYTEKPIATEVADSLDLLAVGGAAQGFASAARPTSSSAPPTRPVAPRSTRG